MLRTNIAITSGLCTAAVVAVALHSSVAMANDEIPSWDSAGSTHRHPAHEGDTPPIDWPDEGIKVAQPAYGMQIESITKQGSAAPSYKLTAKRWGQLVYENPQLARLHRQERLLPAGATLLGAGLAWLTISSAFAVDGFRTKSAAGSLFQWWIPGAMAASGLVMTTVAVTARRKLDLERQRFYMAPYATRESGGATVHVRF